MRGLACSLFVFGFVVVSHPAASADVPTVDFTNPAVAANMSPTAKCQERTSHYFITDTGAGAGWLNIASQWKCDFTSGHGSVGVCQLDQALRCRSDIQIRDKSGNPKDLSGYVVSSHGVTANGELHPWVNPQAAVPILSVIENPALNPLARQQAQNEAVLKNMGGADNFTALLTARVCRFALVTGGVLQPTAQEAAQAEQDRRNGAKITVDTTPEHLNACKETLKTFCGRTDLPSSLTQMDDYKAVCGGSARQ